MSRCDTAPTMPHMKEPLPKRSWADARPPDLIFCIEFLIEMKQ